jgi:hypothetical protein
VLVKKCCVNKSLQIHLLTGCNFVIVGDRMSKTVVLMLLALLALSGLVMVSSVFAQSAPAFTMKFEAHPYDVPTTYGIDQYTGKNITIEEGYHARNETIVFTIKNQFFYNLYYNIRYKGHFGDDWTEYYSYYGYSTGDLVPQSDSAYTVISIRRDYPFVSGAEIDFQVQALIFHHVQVFVYDHPLWAESGGHYEDRITLQTASVWSNTQTMTFPLILPNVTLLLPDNDVFNTSDVQLDFVVDRPVSQIEYCLDGKANVTIVGNTTLSGLPNGYHNVTVYAMDEAGKTGASETVFFTVTEPPEPFPTTLVIASVITVVIVGSGLIVYFKKRKH